MGRRSGKSWSAAHEVLPWLLTPNTRGWIVGPNYNLANKIAREVKRIVMTQLKLPIASKKEISGDLYYMKLAGLNSELSVKSAENQDSLIGEGIDYLIIDEAALIPRRTFEMYLRPKLIKLGHCFYPRPVVSTTCTSFMSLDKAQNSQNGNPGDSQAPYRHISKMMFKN